MDEQELFAALKNQKKTVLLDYLRVAYGEMTAKQRRAVFADAIRQPVKATVDAPALRQEIDAFRKDSFAGMYYAPFNVNSKNYMDVPEKTEEWCARFARFVAAVSKLSARGKHEYAVACFAILYELLEAVDSGKEIFFADEAGSWMIPADEKEWLKLYLTSLAASAAPEAFTAAALPMLKRDSRHSFAGRIYPTALKVANPEQKVLLRAEVERCQIRTPGS